MRLSKNPARKRRCAEMILAAAVASLPAFAPAAGTDNWIGGSSDWNTPANWSGGGVPGAGDTVNVTSTLGLTQTIVYDYPGSVSLGAFTLDLTNATATAAEILSMSANALTVGGSELVGNSGAAGFNQSGGVNTINIGKLLVGNNFGSTGTYSLSGGKLKATTEDNENSSEYIGDAGVGNFNQSGGTNMMAGSLVLGDIIGATGTYNLSNTGTLVTGGSEYLGGQVEVNGAGGLGIFNQTGGMNSIGPGNFLVVGLGGGSSGNYTLSNGLLSVVGGEQIGSGGKGSFLQTGGMNVTDDLDIVNLSGTTGSYTLQSGTLSAGTVATNAGGTFTQSGGAFTFTAFNQNGGSVSMAPMTLGTGGSGTNFSQSEGTLSSAVININSGGAFTSTGGALAVDTFNLNGGSATFSSIVFDTGAAIPVIGLPPATPPPTFNFSSGILAAATAFLGQGGGVSNFAQTAGPAFTFNDMYVGFNAGSTATYTLSGTSSLNINLSNTALFVGYNGTGIFNQSGGSQISGTLYVGYNAGSTGAFLLSGTETSTDDFKEYIGHLSSGSFNQSGGANTVGSTLIIADQAGVSGAYTLSGGVLTDNGNDQSNVSEYVGNNGIGTFTQTGGTNSFISSLAIGNAAGATGTYTLSGSGSISAGTAEFVGINGAGIFNQSGGTNTINSALGSYLRLGANPGSTGTYLLSGTGTLLANQTGLEENIGYAGAGNFIQSGGVNSAWSLIVGDINGSSGTYTLTAGTLLNGAGGEVIDSGNFNQTGGISTGIFLTIGDSNNLPNAGTGTYALSGTGSLSASIEYVGYFGSGAFIQTGGNHSVTGLQGNSVGLVIGYNAGAVGSYLLAGGSLSVASNEIVGESGIGNFNQSGGSNVSGGILILGSTAGKTDTYTFSNGLLNVTGIDTSSNASEYVGYSAGTGTFVQTGGANIVSNGLQIGYQGNAIGSYTLAGNGTLMVGGAEYLGEQATGSFVQTGGLNSISGSLTTQSGAKAGLLLGSSNPWLGTYTLSSGSLYAAFDEMIGEGGTGTFIQTGGDNNCPADVVLGHVAGNGSYTISGGWLEAGVLGMGDYIKTKGTFNLSGTGVVTVTGNEGIGSNVNSSASTVGNLNQSGGLNIAGSVTIGNSSNAFGTYTLTGGTLTVSGAMTLTGTNSAFNATGGVAAVGTVSSAGVVDIGVASNSSGSLTVNGNYSETAGVTQIDGALTFANGGSFILNAGTLKGTGSINGPIFNVGGVVSPGDSPGQLNLNGNYTQSAAGAFDVLLGGYTPGVNYSVLAITGDAALAGRMEVDLVGGFTPQIGDQFTFLTAGLGVTGGFSALASNNGLFAYAVNYGGANNRVEITVTSIPEPSCAALIAAWGGMMLARRRRTRPDPGR